MRYIVYVTSYIYTDISGGNLIGEGRWERNVLDALVKDGRDVYVVPWTNDGEWDGVKPRIWRSDLPVPPNLKDYYQLDQSSMEDTLFIGHSPPGAIDVPVKAKRYVLQWFNGPDNDADRQFKNLLNNNPGSVVATYNFPICGTKLLNQLGKENVVNIHGPAVPAVHPGVDNFDAEYLLWMSKKLHAYSTDDRMIPVLRSIFSWCRTKLQSNSNLKLCFLLGTVGPHKTVEEVQNWFWKCDFSAPLRGVEGQVNFLYSVEWNKMDSILSKTKMVVHAWPGYGGGPYELSAFGVPLVLCQNGHPFQNSGGSSLFAEVMTVPEDFSGEIVSKLEQLYSDRGHYTRTGNAYRNFVASNGTYSAYLEQLDNLCRQRGWF